VGSTTLAKLKLQWESKSPSEVVNFAASKKMNSCAGDALIAFLSFLLFKTKSSVSSYNNTQWSVGRVFCPIWNAVVFAA
jgi:hypothetical protein